MARAADGRKLAHLPISQCDEVLFLADGSLLTSNELGLVRWPSRPVGTDGLHIGPPEPLAWLGPGTAGVRSGRRQVPMVEPLAPTSPNAVRALLVDRQRPGRRRAADRATGD